MRNATSGRLRLNEATELVFRVVFDEVSVILKKSPGRLPKYLRETFSQSNVVRYLCERYLARLEARARYDQKMWDIRVELATHARNIEEARTKEESEHRDNQDEECYAPSVPFLRDGKEASEPESDKAG